MSQPRTLRCAAYTRKSSEEGLDQDFNSLEAQREPCEAYIRSQAQEGWTTLPVRFDDGGSSGGNIDRPGREQLMGLVREGKVDVIVIDKIDRLTRSLTDFARLAETFDRHGVSFVSVTQQFNTTTSMGQLMPQCPALVRKVRAYDYRRLPGRRPVSRKSNEIGDLVAERESDEPPFCNVR